MTDKLALKKAIGDTLNSHNFLRKGQSWFLRGPDCTVVLNLQKDEFSDLYYVNFGVWLAVFGNNQYPQENQCHVRARLERIFPTQRELIYDACTIGPDQSFLSEFVKFLREDVIPLCASCLTLKDLKGNIVSGRIPLHHVYYAAKVALGLTDPA